MASEVVLRSFVFQYQMAGNSTLAAMPIDLTLFPSGSWYSITLSYQTHARPRHAVDRGEVVGSPLSPRSDP